MHRFKALRRNLHWRLTVHRGLTLVELLVVMGILGILAGLLMPAVQSTREAARVAICRDKLRQLCIALQHHECTVTRLPVGHEDADGKFPYQPWTAKLLPYMEQSQLFHQIQQAYGASRNPFDQSIHQNFASVLPSFACPSDARVSQPQVARGTPTALTSYVGVNGTNFGAKDGIFYFRSKTRLADISDGLSNTLAVIERPPSRDFYFGWWYAGMGSEDLGAFDCTVGTAELNVFGAGYLGARCFPGPHSMKRRTLLDAQCGIFHPWSLHSTVSAGRADGSVVGLSYDTDPQLFSAMGTRAGGEVVSLVD